jgi:hypothetical protein
MKMKLKVFFLIFLIINVYAIEIDKKISLKSFFKSKANLIVKTEKKETEILEKTYINSKNKNEEAEEKKSEQTLQDDEDEDLEEEWEIYGDERVKTDKHLRTLYRSFKKQFSGGKLSLQSALLQYNEHMRGRRTNSTNFTNSTRVKEWEDDEQDKLDKAGEVAENVGACITSFYDSFSEGEFCWKSLSGSYPKFCECGYSFYNNACYENCPPGFIFTKGKCYNRQTKTSQTSKKVIKNLYDPVFRCPSKLYKSGRYCYEDCGYYNMVECGLGCAKDSTSCALTIVNMIFGTFMAVFNIVVAIGSLGTAGKAQQTIQKSVGGSFLKKMWNRAKELGKKALETLKDPKTYSDFLFSYTASVGSNLCGEIASALMKRTAQGPQDVADPPPTAERVFNHPLAKSIPVVGQLASGIIETTKKCGEGSGLDCALGVASITPLGGITDAAKDMAENCGKEGKGLDCAKAVMSMVGELDPTGILAGFMDLAKTFMYPICSTGEPDKPEDTSEDEEQHD